MFNHYKELKELLGKIFELHGHCTSEINSCDEYLLDLPNDINSVNELEDIIRNNKDLSRAYDLGRKETLEELRNIIKNWK